MAFGVVVGVVGIITGVEAKSTWNNYFSYDWSTGTRAVYNSLGNKAAKYGKVATATLIVGGAAVAAGVTMLIVDLVKGSKHRRGSGRRAMYLAPVLMPRGGGLAAGFSF